MAIQAGGEEDFQPCRVIVGRVGSGRSSAYSFCRDPGTIREFPDGASMTLIPICERHRDSLDGGTIYAVVAVPPNLAGIELL